MRTAAWHTSPLNYAAVRKLTQTLGTSEILASVLVRRGYDTPEAAGKFLSPAADLYDPFLFPEMKRVCARLRQAIAGGEKICIHGDYDVDGITSTALLASVLQELGANVSCHLPNRFTEGYGVAIGTVEKIAAAGAALLVTVDCGISAREPLERAAQLGLECIVIDHHRPAEDGLPPAMIISPLLCDYPFKELAGVGLAFKVAQALLAGLQENGDGLSPMLRRQLDLVALGTIADVVPVLDENRSLIKRGLIQLAHTSRPGLKALMLAGRVDRAAVNAGLVAFRLAPRINAAGRLDDPEPALKLLLSEDEDEAVALARHLDGLNRERQQIENKMIAEAEELISRLPGDQKASRGYVLSSPGWHEGVIGIVASRLVEMHRRPVIMISEGDEHGKGSGRSIPTFDLHQSLQSMRHLLQAFGGHRAACGLTIGLEQIPDFKREFAAWADAALADGDLRPNRYIDALVLGPELTLELAEELSRLEPFGLGNPSVSLLAPGARILAGRATRDGRHFQCQVEIGGAKSSAIGFRQAFLADQLPGPANWDVAFRLERNEWNGSVAPQLNLRELFPKRATETGGQPCSYHCNYDCPERVQGEEFWSLFLERAPLAPAWLPENKHHGSASTEAHGHLLRPFDDCALAGRLIDRRGLGNIQGQIAQLISTGNNVLLLAADVARRRQLLGALPLSNSGIGRVLLAGSRCAAAALKQRLGSIPQSGPVLALADFATVAIMPEAMANFNHIVFVDPPLNRAIFHSVAGNATDANIHLLHCPHEVQFTMKVLEHEYSLRAPIIKVYRHLETGKTYPLDETTERLLLAGGKYLRQPAMVARCLKVLEDLGLISVERQAGKPIMMLRDAGRTELENSAAYRQIQAFYEECLKFLSKSQDVKMA